MSSEHFVTRVFADEEIRYAASRGDPARHFASAFAAREALAKASGLGMFGLGIFGGWGAWVCRTEKGPVMMMSREIKLKLSAAGDVKCWLSLTHEDDLALAFVVLEAGG